MEAVYEMMGYPKPKRVVVLGIQGRREDERARNASRTRTTQTPEVCAPDQIISTVGMNIAKISNAELNVELTFWDLGGAFGLRGIWESYFQDADACLYVVDGAEERALEESMVELERAMRNKRFSKSMPILIVSAKSDLSGPEGLEMVRSVVRRRLRARRRRRRAASDPRVPGRLSHGTRGKTRDRMARSRPLAPSSSLFSLS